MKPARTDIDWSLIKRDYIDGMSFPKLAEKYGVSAGGIHKRKEKEGWYRAALMKSSAVSDRLAEGESMPEEVERDVAVMALSASTFERLLKGFEQDARRKGTTARDRKLIAEGAKVAMEAYRKVRDLDQQSTIGETLDDVIRKLDS